MITLRSSLSVMLAGVLLGSLVMSLGCHSPGARKTGIASTPPPSVTAVKPVVQGTPAATASKPGFFARLFGSKARQPASTNATQRGESKPTPPSAVVVVKPVKPGVQETPAATVDKPGFFARLFGSKTDLSASTASAQTEKPKPVTVAPVHTDTNRTFIPYRIQVNDTLIVAMRGITPEQPNVELVVDEHGEIKLPYINNIKAEGRTTSELETLIRETYIQQKIYKRITVNIIVPAMTSPTFYVKGEVHSPGRLPYVNGMTLLTTIAAAGGPTDFATPNMELLRGGKKIKFNYYDLEKHPDQDQPIQAGDIVIVNKTWF
ncbi:MAG: polysaccharide biosynthesis/export family protein [Kiritimatiellaeota bacterium]|nr:polysaccharide biosynthesis/export family protein [Kiritimatiellota bacterium]